MAILSLGHHFLYGGKYSLSGTGGLLYEFTNCASDKEVDPGYDAGVGEIPDVDELGPYDPTVLP
jgi:hypothetical protein